MIEVYTPKNILEQIFLSKSFMALWIFMVYTGAMIFQHTERLTSTQGLLFSAIICCCGILQWISSSLKDHQNRILLIVYGSLIFISSFIMPAGAFAVQVGLLPVWIAQSLMIYKNICKPIAVFLFMYTVFYIISAVFKGIWLPHYLAVFFLVLASIIPFSIITKRQLNAHDRMQNYLKDLETIHQKVEKLTVANERQRMARDLHDTLAQGLVGLIMQLEATDVYLLKGDIGRSQEIVQQSMQQARRTLHEARQAIDNLRSSVWPKIGFSSAVEAELRRFKEITTIDASSDIGSIGSLPSLVKEHSLYMLSECLTNIAKHAKADKVIISIKQESERLLILVEDNGIGMNTKMIGKQPGHYGLVGLHERAKLLGGTIHIYSSNKKGTRVKISLPVQEKGEEHEL